MAREPQPRSLPQADIGLPDTTVGRSWRPRITRRGAGLAGTLGTTALVLLACAGPSAGSSSITESCDTGTTHLGHTTDLSGTVNVLNIDLNRGDSAVLVVTTGPKNPEVDSGNKTEVVGDQTQNQTEILTFRKDGTIKNLEGNATSVRCVAAGDLAGAEQEVQTRHPLARITRFG